MRPPGRTMNNHTKRELNIKGTIAGGAIFLKCIRQKLERICVFHVDDALQEGSKEYQKPVQKTEEKFKCKGRTYD